MIIIHQELLHLVTTKVVASLKLTVSSLSNPLFYYLAQPKIQIDNLFFAVQAQILGLNISMNDVEEMQAM